MGGRRPVRLRESGVPLSARHDPLVEPWVGTWSRLRERRVSMVDGWPLVHVDSASRRTELICADPTESTIRSLLSHIIGDTEAMLTVVGADLTACRSVAWGAGVRVDRDDETLMTTNLVATGAPTVPAGLHEDIEIDGPRTTCRLIDSGRVAAEATMAIDDRWATFDRVETLPSHRRRGLGRHVMTELSVRAVANGATRGILAASADGRDLYESLGWTVERELLSLMGQDEQATSS